MHLLRLVALGLLVALAVPVDAGFGSGAPAFAQYDAPSSLPDSGNAGEPTIGIPWNTDHVFYQAYSSTYRITFDGDDATWEDVTSPDALPVNLDPMLHADPDTGRVWAGGLYTVCSVMQYTDDDGATWAPTANMCGVYGLDHQTIGSGPWADPAPPVATYEHAVYYCAHGEAISFPPADPAFGTASPTACLVSHDGGVTWGPPVPWVGGCGSLHGHVRVSPVTGFAAVPDANCATGPGSSDRLAGFAYSADNGLTWMSRTVAGSTAYSPFDNPSLAFGHGEGWLWYGQAADDGAFIALSKNEGVDWEAIGAGMGVDATTWLDVGAFHDPPIVEATFPDVQVGDDDRVAFSFLGLEDTDGDGTAEEYLDNNQCDQDPEIRYWHYYIALSYDGGETWTVQRMTDDPVQVGGIYQGQGDPCRNLLDFNDMDLDSTGRIHISFADGCTGACAQSDGNDTSDGFRTAYASLLRQTDGKGLFAAYDQPEPEPTATETDTDTGEGRQTPGVGVLATLALVGAAVAVRRRGQVE